jgi:hypothetical protein
MDDSCEQKIIIDAHPLFALLKKLMKKIRKVMREGKEYFALSMRRRTGTNAKAPRQTLKHASPSVSALGATVRSSKKVLARVFCKEATMVC